MSDEITRTTTSGGLDLRTAIPRPDKDAVEGGRPKGKRRRKVSYLTANKIDYVDYKDVNVLRRFLNDRFKILPSRQTGNTAKQQRMISSAIRRARELALIPFVATEIGVDKPAYGPRRDRDRDRDRDRAPRQSDNSEAAAE